MAYVKSIPEAEESVAAVMGRFPEQALPLMQFSENILRAGECEFSLAERELIAAYASGLTRCIYSYETHKATAEALGVAEGLLERLLEDPEGAPIDDKFRPVLRYVRILSLTPSQVRRDDADAVFAAGWDEQSFHYAVMIAAMFNMMSRILIGYGVENTAEFRRERGRILAEAGYLPYAPGGEAAARASAD